jgi:YHS domain-containing protein
MLLRLLLFVIFAVIVARAFWRLVDGIVEGLGGRRPAAGQVQNRGVQMVRDPVCGTFVLPDRALTLVDGRGRLFFCSDACRTKYQARPSTSSGSARDSARGERPAGRTA